VKGGSKRGKEIKEGGNERGEEVKEKNR